MYSGFGLSGSDTESEPPTPPAYPQVSQSHLSPQFTDNYILHFQLSGNRYIVSFSLGTKILLHLILAFPYSRLTWLLYYNLLHRPSKPQTRSLDLCSFIFASIYYHTSYDCHYLRCSTAIQYLYTIPVSSGLP